MASVALKSTVAVRGAFPCRLPAEKSGRTLSAARSYVSAAPVATRCLLRRPQPRRRTLPIVNYIKSVYDTVDRERQLCELGNKFVQCWFEGVMQGPDKILPTLGQYLDPTVKFSANQVLSKYEGQGISFLRNQLLLEHHRTKVTDYKVLLCASTDEDDTCFALVQYTYQGPKPNLKHTGYKVMIMDVMLDDTCRKITEIQERGQLAPEDLDCVVTTISDAYQVCNATPFPEEDLGEFPQGLPPNVIKNNAKAWCDARCTGHSEEVLDQILDPNFRLWDAYGFLPVLCDPTRRSQKDACVVPYASVKDIVKQFKSRYDIQCKLIDHATATKKNGSFTHWRSTITNHETKEHFAIEGVQVEIFNPQGKLTDIWLFRDPMDVEKTTLGMRR